MSVKKCLFGLAWKVFVGGEDCVEASSAKPPFVLHFGGLVSLSWASEDKIQLQKNDFDLLWRSGGTEHNHGVENTENVKWLCSVPLLLAFWRLCVLILSLRGQNSTPKGQFWPSLAYRKNRTQARRRKYGKREVAVKCSSILCILAALWPHPNLPRIKLNPRRTILTFWPSGETEQRHGGGNTTNVKS